MTKLFRTFLAIKPSSYITELLNKTIEELKNKISKILNGFH